jgi:Bacteriophage baseplate protein W
MSTAPSGFHVAFPLAMDARGQTTLAGEERYLKGLIEQVLFTRPGERVNRPDLGSGIDSLVFAPAGDELAQTTRALVHGALQRFLGDLIRVEDVGVVANESTVEVTVAYVPLRTVSGAPARVVQVSAGAGVAP